MPLTSKMYWGAMAFSTFVLAVMINTAIDEAARDREIRNIFMAAGATDPREIKMMTQLSRGSKKSCALLIPSREQVCKEVHDRFFNQEPAPH